MTQTFFLKSQRGVSLSSTQKFLARFPICNYNLRRSSRAFDSTFCVSLALAGPAEEEISQRCASTDSVVAHNQHFGISVLDRLLVELEGASVKPPRSRFFVVMEAQPDV